MKLFRHICLFGNIYEQYFSTDAVPHKQLNGCPEKINCGNHWEEVDLGMYPGGSPFVFVELKEQEK